MVNLLNAYPFLVDSHRINLNIANEFHFLVVSKNKFKLNEDALKVLTLCDGSKTLKQISKYIYYSLESENIEKSVIEKKVLEFINIGLQNKFIEVSDKPQYRPVKILEFTNFYPPQHLSIELTDKCNLRCTFCYLGERRKDDSSFVFINTELLLAKLDELSNFGLEAIELTGGEPLLHPDFKEIFIFCAEKFQVVGILTNGYLISEKLVNLFSKYKRKLFFNVSIDSYDEKTHDKLRGLKGSFKRAVNAIKLLSEKGLMVRAAMTVLPETVTHIKDTLIFCKEIGATVFNYSPVLPFGYGGNYLMDNTGWDFLPKEQILKIQEIEKELYLNYKDYIPYLSDLKSMKNCGAGYRSYSLAPDGTLKMCALTDKEIIKLPNLFSEECTDIFSHYKLKLFEELVAPDFDLCDGCKYKTYCYKCSLRGIKKSFEVDKCNWKNKNKEILEILLN